MSNRFWETTALHEMDSEQWESLCDGCGRCCLQQLEDEDTGTLVRTRISCHLLDEETCRCNDYENRRAVVPNCLHVTPDNIEQIKPWMPPTCAYRLIHEGKPLEKWHPLISGDKNSVFEAGIAVRGWNVSERYVPEADWQDYPVKWVHDKEAMA